MVALVLSGFALAGLHAQEPQQWPQDDPYPGQPGYSQPQQYPQPSYNPPQSYPQYQYPQQGYPPSYAQPGYPQAQGMNAEQLEQLVAPVALYPDGLLAQILAASTYPAQVAAADQWLRSMGNTPPEQIAAGANSQTGLDPSVKALTAYPQVLEMMDHNLQWTTDLGNAYYNQPQDLLQTVQVLRQRAETAGNLQSTPQEQVTNNPGYFALAPPDPDVVYVPSYNPWAVYGQPIEPYSNYDSGDTVGAVVGTAIQYGLSFAVGAFFHAPFGFLSWGLDWLGNAILFNHDPWYSHSVSVADWGFARGGPRAFRGGEFARYGDRFDGGYRGSFPPARPEWGHNRGNNGFPPARPEQSYRNPGGFNRGTNYPPARPEQSFGGRDPGQFGRGYMGYGSTHPAQPQQYAYNRMPEPVGRPQPYQGRTQQFSNYGNYGQRPGYGSGYGSGLPARPVENYGAGRSFSYASPSPVYRAPTPSFGHGGFGRPPSNAYAGAYGSSGHSGGFHLFGGGHNESPRYGGGHNSWGGGHSFGGGGGHSFGGGGHSFGGGGHSFGGGHSGGGGHSHHH